MIYIAEVIFIGLALGLCAVLERVSRARRPRAGAAARARQSRTAADRWARIATGGSVKWK